MTLAQQWTVARASGEVWIGSAGVQSISLQSGAPLAAGSMVTTSPNGRALLVRGEQKMLLAPNTVVVLPGSDEGMTTVLQAAGEMLVEVDKRQVRHFSVETPYLAAVVKGTQFKVRVNSAGAEVEVEGGRVLVSDHDTGESTEIGAGQRAGSRAASGSGLHVGGAGDLPGVAMGTPRSPVVQPLTRDENGRPLVRAAAPGQIRKAAEGRPIGDPFAGGPGFGRAMPRGNAYGVVARYASEEEAETLPVGLRRRLFGGSLVPGWGRGNAYGVAGRQVVATGDWGPANGNGNAYGLAGQSLADSGEQGNRGSGGGGDNGRGSNNGGGSENGGGSDNGGGSKSKGKKK